MEESDYRYSVSLSKMMTEMINPPPLPEPGVPEGLRMPFTSLVFGVRFPACCCNSLRRGKIGGEGVFALINSSL